jgi:hypothetical protein
VALERPQSPSGKLDLGLDLCFRRLELGPALFREPVVLRQIVDAFRFRFELRGGIPHLGRSIFERADPAFDVADGVGAELECQNGHLQSFEPLLLGSLRNEAPEQLDSLAGVKAEGVQFLFHGSRNCLLRPNRQ